MRRCDCPRCRARDEERFAELVERNYGPDRGAAVEQRVLHSLFPSTASMSQALLERVAQARRR